MLDVEGGVHVDAGVEQLVDVLIPLGMPGSGRVGVRQLVDEGEHGCPLQYAVEVQVGQRRASVLHRPPGKHLQALQQPLGLHPPVGLDEADYHIDTLGAAFVSGFEHGVGLPDTGRIPEEDLETSAMGSAVFRLHGVEQLVGIWASAFHRISLPWRERPAPG